MSETTSEPTENLIWRILDHWALYLVMGGVILSIALSHGYGTEKMTLSLGYYLTATGLLLMAAKLKLRNLYSENGEHWALRWSGVVAALLVCGGTAITLGLY